jgi:heterodisulfide reductase subunit C
MADHKYESFIQKDNVIIDGIDISGEWNKMYEPREITEYDITFLEKVRDLPGAESMGWCYQCAQCVGVCPVENVGSYGPRKIYRKLQTGVISSNILIYGFVLHVRIAFGSAPRKWT